MAQTNIHLRSRSRRNNRVSAQRSSRGAIHSRKRSGILDEVKELKSKRQKINRVGQDESTRVLLGQGSNSDTAQAAQERNVKQSKLVQGQDKPRLPKSIEEELATLAGKKPRFRKVLSQLKFREIAALASRTRQKIEYHEKGRPVRRVRCQVSPRAANGSFNLVFIINFDDGVRWGLKIPANGHRGCFVESAAEALKSEALTMQTIQRETTIPLPTVYGFNNTMDNELGCPYIMMEWLQGKPLWEVWFDKKASPARLEQIRLRALQTIAAAMVQLNGYQSDCSGAWRFDAGLNPFDVSGAKVVDMWTIREGTNDEEPDDLLVEKDPSPDPMDTLLFMLNRRGMEPQSNARGRGIDISLKLFTRWASERASSEGPNFVLAHPDFDIQNMLVDGNGALCGILDWDGVAFVPHSVGCLKYPMFLTRDWCFDDYNYDPESGGMKWSNGPIENSPKELVRYRTIYAQFVEAAFPRGVWEVRTIKAYGDVTRRSALTASLAMADQYPQCIEGIMKVVYHGIDEITADGSADVGTTNYLCGSIGSIPANSINQSESETKLIRAGEGTASTEEHCDADDEKETHQENDSGEDNCDNEPEDHHADTFKTDASHADQVEDGSIDVECKRRIAEDAQLSLDARVDTVVDQSLTPLDNSNNVAVRETGVEAPDVSRKVKVARYFCLLAEKGCRKAAEAVRKIPNPGSNAKNTRAVEEGSPGTTSVQTRENAAPSNSQTCRAAKYLYDFSPQKVISIAGIWCRGSAETKPSVAKSGGETPRDETFEIKNIAGQTSTDLGERVEPASVLSELEHCAGCLKRKEKTPSAAKEEDGIPATKDSRQVWAAIATKVEDAGNSAAAIKEHRDEIAECIIEKLREAEKLSDAAKVARKAEIGAKALSRAREISRGNNKADQEETTLPNAVDRPDTARRLMGMLKAKQPGGASPGDKGAEHVNVEVVRLDPAVVAAKKAESVTIAAAAPKGLTSTIEKSEGEPRDDENEADSWLFDADEDLEVASNEVYRQPIDKGRFNMKDICVALGNDTLDEGRYSRLRLGFDLMLDFLLGKV